MHRIAYSIKDYDWGSTKYLTNFLRASDVSDKLQSNRIAEIWFGSHKEGDSFLENGQTLSEYIKTNPLEAMGRASLDRFGPKLPYLLKLIAIDKNLSLQVHPEAHIARHGFNIEESKNIPYESPKRTFKDMNAKHEMLFALTESQVAVGFSTMGQIYSRLSNINSPIITEICACLRGVSEQKGLNDAVEYILNLNKNGGDIEDFLEVFTQIKERFDNNLSMDILADEIFIRSSEDFDLKDPSSLIILLMNCVTLNPSDAVYLNAGEIHCYHRGFGIEIMVNSDNVIRGGLTTKYIDKRALEESTHFSVNTQFRQDAKLRQVSESPKVLVLIPELFEFALVVGYMEDNERVNGDLLPASGPRILVCIEGELNCATKDWNNAVKQGEAIFIDDIDGDITIESNSMKTIFTIGYCR